MSISTSPGFSEVLQRRLAGIVELHAGQVAALAEHYELLLKWNRVLNLTSVDSLEEAVELHYGEALFLARHLPAQPSRIADIGSGAGFPGIPVAVFRPDCHVTLIESHQRKAVFLREATRKLPNVRVMATRAEEVSEPFDRAISRAVSYADLAPILKKIARAADLLTGSEEPPGEICFEWNPPIRIPWSRNRFLRMGVSREEPESGRFRRV